jgi:Leucine-rich repeat (LRR) protein
MIFAALFPVAMIAYVLILSMAVRHGLLTNHEEKKMSYKKALKMIKEAKDSNAFFLDLSHISFATLPPEIGQLTGLQTLDLRNNQLTDMSQVEELRSSGVVVYY